MAGTPPSSDEPSAVAVLFSGYLGVVVPGACRGCGNCRYVSVSLRERDCSWYRECSLDGLQTAFSAGHRTYPVERPVT